MDDKLIYIYCISDSPFQSNNQSWMNGLSSLTYGKFFAIVKSVSSNEFSEENLKKNFADLAWIEMHAREHIRIITEVMKDSSVIPFKFGTIFNSKESLGIFISDYSETLADNLRNTKGREEWSLKIYCDRTILNQQINELSEEVSNLDQEIARSMPGKAFLLKRKKVELIGLEIEKIMRKCGQTIYEEIASASEHIKVNNILPKEVTERTDDMILNISCFISQNKIDDFLSIVSESSRKFDNSGFTIDAAGPWPPFSFISIQEK